jgi:hypothetical protein
LIAGSTAGAAPGEVGGAEEGLGAGCCVDATGDAELEGVSGGWKEREGEGRREDRRKGRRNTNLPAEFCASACGATSTGTFLAIVVALSRN